MKKTKDIVFDKQIEALKQSLITRYEIDEKFFMTIYKEISSKYSELICGNYNIDTLDSNYLIVYKIFLTICLNHEFDKDRFDNISYDDSYNDVFVRRVVSQVLYSDLASSTFQMSNIINHPILLILFSISHLIKYRATNYDVQVLKARKRAEYTPIFILIKEAMDSLEATLTLIAQKNFSQAMTIYRLYLEQIILVMAIVKNPHLINKYIEHQKLAERYAKDTSDPEIIKLIEEKKIPARDIKSFLSYGWIEGMDGFDELPKARYSIKMMAKLSNTSRIYELYASSTNYVHMNFLLTGVNWIEEINSTLIAIYATVIGIINNYKTFSNFNFIYKNMDLANEVINILTVYEEVLKNKGKDYDILRLKTA